MEGTKQYRFEENPKEKELHDMFIELFNNSDSGRNILSSIIFGWSNDRQNSPTKQLTQEEETMCVNLIQWLGSPVGQSFLEDCGFILKK